MKYLSLISLILFSAFWTMASAQVPDKEKKSIRIPAETSKKDKDSSLIKAKVAPTIKKEKDKTGKSKNEPKKYILKETEKPFSMTEDDGLISASEIFEQRWKKEAVKGGYVRAMSDQFLGEHRVDTKFVNIVCRDHEFPDGDRVKVIVNGEVVKQNLLLTSSYRRVAVNLLEGRNIVDIVALNQGDSGPNTAEFVIYDDKGKVVSSKEWNLLTGVKARIIFVNERMTIKSKDEVSESDNDEASNN